MEQWMNYLAPAFENIKGLFTKNEWYCEVNEKNNWITFGERNGNAFHLAITELSHHFRIYPASFQQTNKSSENMVEKLTDFLQKEGFSAIVQGTITRATDSKSQYVLDMYQELCSYCNHKDLRFPRYEVFPTSSAILGYYVSLSYERIEIVAKFNTLEEVKCFIEQEQNERQLMDNAKEELHNWIQEIDEQVFIREQDITHDYLYISDHYVAQCSFQKERKGNKPIFEARLLSDDSGYSTTLLNENLDVLIEESLAKIKEYVTNGLEKSTSTQ